MDLYIRLHYLNTLTCDWIAFFHLQPQEVPVLEEPVIETVIEVKVEELPPPLPASPPPTEAPPPTPVATTPAPASQIPDVSLHAETDTQDIEVSVCSLPTPQEN